MTDIQKKMLLSRRDILRDYGVSQSQSKRIFLLADEIDSKLKYRVDEKKVLRSSVEVVLGIKKEPAGTDSQVSD